MGLTAVPMLWLASIIAGAVKGFTGSNTYALFTWLGGLLLIILSKIPTIIRNIGTDIVVTDRRLHSKRGIVDVDDNHETPLTNIDDTISDPTVFGRMFGYGDVMIRTFGSSDRDQFTFRNVTDPHELVAVINETRDGLTAGSQTPYNAFQQQQEAHRNASRPNGTAGGGFGGGAGGIEW